jgi:predicted anti-sigma-YlaC factor YlaD
MFCDEALDSVERIAAGDLIADGRIADHLATCPNCSAALESARRVERLLRQRDVPHVSPQFTANTLGRVRRARWRSDQLLDAGFNLGIAAIVVAMISAVWMALNRSGLAAVSNDAVGLLASGLTTFTSRIAPAVPLYGGAAALVATALAIWWWAERDSDTANS